MPKKVIHTAMVIGHGVKYQEGNARKQSVLMYNTSLPGYVGQLVVVFDSNKCLKTITMYVTKRDNEKYVIAYENKDPDPEDELKLFNLVVEDYPIGASVTLIEDYKEGSTYPIFRLARPNEHEATQPKPENTTIEEVLESKKRGRKASAETSAKA